MNEQRRVIYARRKQILTGADLRDETIRILRGGSRLPRSRLTACPTSAPRWDLDRLADRARRPCGPRDSPATELARQAPTPTSCTSVIMAAAMASLTNSERPRSAPTPCGRSSARSCLRIIDQRWREHLYEMDYLKDGIHLRAMGQKDPLTEWQREGFEMFGQMMEEHRPRVREVCHARAGQGRRSAGQGCGGQRRPILRARRPFPC